ncbi:hypothetical protein AB0D38_42835, partial [Streptomyces sp. NPDC048279]|uniref:fascin domain-containing protein n=1 Tax=Streptomyces sp. NPDC048279 TaxID=3154714 RepID=UPI003427E743
GLRLPRDHRQASGCRADRHRRRRHARHRLRRFLKAHANGDYVTAENAGAAPLIADRTAIGPWEEFDPVNG